MAYARFTEDDGKRIARAVIAVKRQQHRRLPVRNAPIFRTGGGAVMRPCYLSNATGSPGSRTSACTYVYTVTDAITSEEIATSIAPEHARFPGKLYPATTGEYWMDGNTCKLWSTDERPYIGGCV